MYINAMGTCVPATRIDNEYYHQLNGLTSDWIVQRTGIRTRSRATDEESSDWMGLQAIDDALPRLPYDIKDVDLIVSASYALYDSVATLAHVAQRHYGIEGAKAFYMSAACSSFINGMEVVESFFESGKATKALLVCSEKNSYYANETDAKAGHLWGDAAVAYFLSKDPQGENDIKVLDIFTEGLGQVGKGPAGVKLRPKEDGITMPDGRDVFLHACKYMKYALNRSLENTGLRLEDIKCLAPHQANARILAQVAHLLDLPSERVLHNIEELGNTGSASAPLVLAQHIDELAKGERAAAMVFGGGYSCGCFIIEK